MKRPVYDVNVEAMIEQPSVTEPIQRRSRASTDRMLACASELFIAGGYEAVAVGQVARQAGVAVGTIYGRFGNKDGLINAVQVRLLEVFREETLKCEMSREWTQTPPERLMSTLVRSLADLLCSQASYLRPIMQRANNDPHTAEMGKAGYEQLRLAFLRAALRARPVFRHRDPERACESCFEIAYATFARLLGLGSFMEVSDPGKLPAVAEDLGRMCEAYLLRSD